ncbi:hypothetical protein SK128_013140 [Halocaridina rubra]|uniref:C3H1-type domain-containing protein n=1 Tax=Halocaridina rubra TaxID=373956 RepID=A0AAN9A6A9_HALRR
MFSSTQLQPGWNPMAEDYLDTENRYLDNECAEMVLSGIKNTDETRVCKLYCSGKVCHYGETCRYEHTRPRDGVTCERVPVFHLECSTFDLPAVGSVVAALVTSVISPSHFYVYLPYGITDIRQPLTLCDEDDSDSLEKLSVAMLEYYRYSAPEHSATLPAIGEIKALCEIVDGELTFSRVRVLNVYNKNRGTLIEVFFIDNGNTSWVKEEQLRPFAPQFAHAPPQAIQCYLEGLDKPKKGWNAYSAEQLLQLTEGVTLVAEIMNVDSIEDRLGVVLYNTGGYEDININEALRCILKL